MALLYWIEIIQIDLKIAKCRHLARTKASTQVNWTGSRELIKGWTKKVKYIDHIFFDHIKTIIFT